MFSRLVFTVVLSVPFPSVNLYCVLYTEIFATDQCLFSVFNNDLFGEGINSEIFEIFFNPI